MFQICKEYKRLSKFDLDDEWKYGLALYGRKISELPSKKKEPAFVQDVRERVPDLQTSESRQGNIDF